MNPGLRSTLSSRSFFIITIVNNILQINPGFLGDNQSLAGSRKSVNLQVLWHDDELLDDDDDLFDNDDDGEVATDNGDDEHGDEMVDEKEDNDKLCGL